MFAASCPPTRWLCQTPFPHWVPHPEVWLLVAAIIGFGYYASRVIQPHAIRAGGKPITTRQRQCFAIAVALLWFASDWPLHDLGELRLYSAHMVQHVLFTVVIPPLLLLATPEWLARAIIGDGKFNRWFHRLARPIPAAVLFNILAGITHWAAIVNLAVTNGPFHYTIHALLLGSGLLIWTPVCGPFPELHMTPQGKMVYIFLMSIVPTVPAAFLTASSGVIYQAYDHGPRLWGISVVEDQQLAGAVMKIGEGLYLWAIILVMMIRWLSTDDRRRKSEGDKFRGRLVTTVPAPPSGHSTDTRTPPDYSQN